MVLNDCFDYPVDKVHRLKRPLVDGRIKLQTAWKIGWSLLLTGVVFAFSASFVSGIVGTLLATLIVLYNYKLKEGVVGAFMMANCRLYNYLLGASFSVYAFAEIEQLIFCLPIFFYIFGLTYLAKQEEEARDRSAVSVTVVSILITLIVLFVCLWVMSPLGLLVKSVFSGLLIVFCIPLIKRILSVYKDFRPSTIQALIKQMLIYIIPLDFAIALLYGEYVIAGIIILCLPLCRWAASKTYMT